MTFQTVRGKLIVVATYGALFNVQLTQNPFFSGRPTIETGGRPQFMLGNRIYQLRSTLNLIQTEEVVAEMKQFLDDYQVGIDLAGERNVPITVVIIGLGEVKNDDLGDEAMESVVGTLSKMAEDLNVSVLFTGVNEIPTRSTLRGRWFHEMLELMASRAPILEGTNVTYADVWTPDIITDLSVVNRKGVMETSETPQLLGRLRVLAHLIAKFLANEVTLEWLKRPVVPQDYEDNPTMDVASQGADDGLNDEGAGSG
jgi:hypothetical protein